MRIVRHPNIVQLKAFYYSNGERVCLTIYPTLLRTVSDNKGHRRTKSTSTSSRSSCLRQYTERRGFSTR